MSKFVVGMNVEHRKNGEKALIVEGTDSSRVYMNMAQNGLKDYSISTAIRNFKIVQDEVTEEVIVDATDTTIKIEEELEMENKDIELVEENEEELGNVITEEEINASKVNETGEEEKIVGNETVPPKDTTPVEPKVDKKLKYKEMVCNIISAISKDASFENITVRELANDFASVKVTKNFVEFSVTSKKLKINVLQNDTLETELPVRVVPASYGWRANTIVTIQKEEDIPEALRIIKMSYLTEIAPNEKDIAKAAAKKLKDEEKARKLAAKEELKIEAEKAKAEAKKIKDAAKETRDAVELQNLPETDK